MATQNHLIPLTFWNGMFYRTLPVFAKHNQRWCGKSCSNYADSDQLQIICVSSSLGFQPLNSQTVEQFLLLYIVLSCNVILSESRV